MSQSQDWLIVGLGNPGPNYSYTRHNIGYMVLDAMVQSNGLNFKKSSKSSTLVCEARLGAGGPKIILAKSLSYMNTIGQSIVALAKFYKIDSSHIIAVHDELDFALGVIKIKKGGSAGGHNGLKDLTRAFKTENYLRLRLGIGRPQHGSTAHYVLQNFSAAEKTEVSIMIDKAQEAITDIVTSSLEQAQNIHHARNKNE